MHLKPGRHLSLLFEIVEKDVEGMRKEVGALLHIWQGLMYVIRTHTVPFPA